MQDDGQKIKKEHILVCLSSAPSNAKIIQTAARMAKAFDAKLTALFVETPDYAVASLEDKRRLDENKKLAESKGATVEIVYGEEIAYQIGEFARLSGITRIVLGRSAIVRRRFWRKAPLTEQLLAYVPEIDIHIIPDKNAENNYRPRSAQNKKTYLAIGFNIIKSVGILVAATMICLLFSHWHFTDSNIIMVYILGVLLTSIATSHVVYSMISSIASVFIFNYFFTRPRFSFAAYDTGYPVTFIVMFLTAFISGTLAVRYKEQAAQAAKVSYRTRILFDANQMISKAQTKDEIIQATAAQVVKLLGRKIIIVDTEHDDYKKDKRYEYHVLHVNERQYGVVGIEAKEEPLDAFENGILLSILGECALALENEKNAREKEEAAILAKSEQLRANMLRTISHDLRTPLTSISGNASNLLNNGDSFDSETKYQLYSDIYDDSIWLINLVENLLYATRIDEGRMVLQTSTELLSDVIEEAIRHVNRKAAKHQISVEYENELCLVRVDARLVIQVVINIVDNALKYTKSGTSIKILTSEAENNMVEVVIADMGNGISEEEKQYVFDKFYCGERKVVDNRRSLGLGLYLCKAIVEAHGGNIWVEDNEPQGARFIFTLPMEELKIYE